MGRSEAANFVVFEREARTISSLSHPNICSLHDVGHPDGIDYLVMEFLEGETLRFAMHRVITLVTNWTATLPH